MLATAGRNTTDAERSSAVPANHVRISLRPRKVIHVHNHDSRGPWPDKGLTPATTIVGEILGNPSTRLAYKRNPLTLQLSNRGVRPHAEKVHQEKVQQEKLKEVKAWLNFEGCSGRNSKIQEVSQHSESRTPNVRGEHRRGRRSGRSRSMSISPERTSVFSRIRHTPVGKGRRDGGVFNRLGGKEKSVSAHSESRYQSSHSGRTESVPRKRHYEGTCSRRTEMLSESEDSGGGTQEIKKAKVKH
ncbi:hypothetical protein Tco_1062964 [Tanacetum coccineum]